MSKQKIHFVAAFLLSISLVPLVYGYAISVLWEIYARPLGFPAISVIHGYGLHLLVGRLIVPMSYSRAQEEYLDKHGPLMFILTYDLLKPTLWLAVGYALAKIWGLA